MEISVSLNYEDVLRYLFLARILYYNYNIL